MSSLFERISHFMASRSAEPRSVRQYRCQCSRPVFFRNSACVTCHTPLGYEPGRGQVLPLEPAGERPPRDPLLNPYPTLLWREHGQADAPHGAPLFKRCANFSTASGCNWLADPDSDDPFCVACQLNRTVPDFDGGENERLWHLTEVAKRRLVSQLIAMGLPVASREHDPERGLWFDFLRAQPGGPPVMTGHAQGVITLNVDEADDATRERTRAAMREPYRTLLGHLRHEVGHYYWDRLVWNTPWLQGFRALFGDERASYADALARHYEQGPPPEWAQQHISSYAASHPWEDWAETWAHYLHMLDSVDTAASFGIDPGDVEVSIDHFGLDALSLPDGELPDGLDKADARDFLRFVNSWLALTAALNELSRSMGQPDFYPFVMPRPVVAKLHFVHRLVGQAARVKN